MILREMATNGKAMFYEGQGKVKQMVMITDIAQGTYGNSYPLWENCNQVSYSCYLEDSLNGDPFTQMLYLYGQFDSETERESLLASSKKALTSSDSVITLEGH